MIFLVVDSLAFDLILGHDFMAHFSLHPTYAGRPFAIAGSPTTRSAPPLPSGTSTVLGGTSPISFDKTPCEEPSSCKTPTKDDDERLACSSESMMSDDTIFRSVPQQAQLIDFKIKGLDVVFGKPVVGAVAPMKDWVNYPKFSTITTTGLEDVEQWPGLNATTDLLQDDDLAMTLDYAVPDFHDEKVTLPIFDVSKPETQRYRALCEEYSTLFVNKPGHCDLVEHGIPVTDEVPIAERTRPLPHKWRAEISAQLEELERDGLIVRSTSPYKFPCVFVPKKNGKVRMCVDYWSLNKVAKVDSYPLPRPDDVQEHLSGASVFSTLDLRSGYWQMKVRPSDRHRTAFCPGPGFPLFEWVRMPFGLSNAPASFQRLMDLVLGRFNFVRIYLDDILIFSRSEQEHLHHLKLVFDALREAGLTLAGDKCSIGMNSVTYLGHRFSAQGMSPDRAKVDVIESWPTPRTATDLRSFLGLAGYYRHFIPHFSDRAKVLQQLQTTCSKDDVMVTDRWTEDHSVAFVDIKKALADLPFLDYPDFNRPFEMACDASQYAIGGVLEQDGRPLAFYSQTLTGSQLNWPVYEKEACDILKCLERFRHLHYGYKLRITVYSDHRPLQWLKTATSTKLQRWLLALQQYQFDVVYIPGKQNARADALSRVRQPQPVVDDKPTVVPRPVGVVTLHEAFSKDDILRAQKACPIIRQLYTRLLDAQPLRRNELAAMEFRPYRRVWKTLGIADGLVVRERSPSVYTGLRWVPLIPEALRSDFIEHSHDEVGHFNSDKVLDKLELHAYWPGMATDVERHISQCERCLNAKRPSPAPAPLMPVPIGRPWETIAVDLLSVPTNPDGISTLLVLQDYFTKWAHVVPLRQHTWLDVARPLFQLFLLFGPPRRLHSDQGPPFESWLFKMTLGLLGMRKSKSSVYHPAGNGLVERFNQTFLKMLRTQVDSVHDWQRHLGSMVWYYNTSIHSATKASPFYLMYGRSPPDLWFPDLESTETRFFDPDSYARYLSATRAKILDNVDECVTHAASVYKATFDSKSKLRLFKPGLRVRLETLGPARSNKLDPRWEGNWYVSNALPGLHNKTLEIVHPATQRRKIISVDHLLIDPIQPDHLSVDIAKLVYGDEGAILEEAIIPDVNPDVHEDPDLPIVATMEYPITAELITQAVDTASGDPQVAVGSGTSSILRSESVSNPSTPQRLEPTSEVVTEATLISPILSPDLSDLRGEEIEDEVTDDATIDDVNVLNDMDNATASLDEDSSADDDNDTRPLGDENCQDDSDDLITDTDNGSPNDDNDVTSANLQPEFESAQEEEDDVPVEPIVNDLPPQWTLARDRVRRQPRLPARFAPG